MSGGSLEQQQMLQQQQYDMYSSPSPVVINNNPKLKSLLEPFVIPTYGQLKQPNANSAFQSSVISATGANTSSLLSLSTLTGGGGGSGGNGAASSGHYQMVNGHTPTGGGSSSSMAAGAGGGGAGAQNSSNLLTSITGSNLAASAFSSAVLVTENVTNFGKFPIRFFVFII